MATAVISVLTARIRRRKCPATCRDSLQFRFQNSSPRLRAVAKAL